MYQQEYQSCTSSKPLGWSWIAKGGQVAIWCWLLSAVSTSLWKGSKNGVFQGCTAMGGGYMTSRRSGFTGIRRLARCKGSPKCVNDACPYLKQFYKRNRVHFQVKGGENICHSCGAPAVSVACPARKVWEFDDKRGMVDVCHHGEHTCIPQAASKISVETTEDATSKFKAIKKLG